jgi:thiol-disulfide isomerase/thioredoxin
MSKFAMSIVLAGLSSFFVGCSDSDSSSVGSNTTSSKGDETAVASSDAAPATTPLEMNLAEPTPTEQSESTGELIIGDTAPQISIGKWIKGDAVESFAKDQVYVVEFWATWCGPCLANMPHLASLQTEYGDKVTFIGVTAEEDDVVSEFMAQDSRGGQPWSEVLTYTIALDKDRETNTAYMEAAGQNGIPCAFVVGKTGKVEWIGHPAAIDDPLKQVVDGTWDSTKARAEFLAERESAGILEEMAPKINAALQKGDFKTGVELLDQLIAKFPENSNFKNARFQFLLKGAMFDEANKTAAVLFEASKDDALELNQLAWILATGVEGPGPDLDLALAAANRAVELTDSKNASILDTLSRVQFSKGNVEEAIATEKKALEIANAEEKKQFEDSLKEYEAALTKATPDTKPAESGEADPAEEKPSEEKPAEPKEPGDAAATDPAN